MTPGPIEVQTATHRGPDTGTPAPDAPRFGNYPALDGLRAVAVIGVLLFHAGLSRMAGGFLGVEAFFVLSGFLITSLLLVELDATDSIRIGRFWARRARRLLPALVVLIIVVGCHQVIVGSVHATQDLLGSGVSSLLYLGNWQQIWTGGTYFGMTTSPSPLQHTWSLAIEEQFYLVWPVALLGVAYAAKRQRRPTVFRSRAVLAVAVVGCLLSTVAMSVLVRSGNIERVYLGTDTRASGVLVGGALAVVFLEWRRAGRRIPERAIGAAGLVGLGCLLLAFGVVSGTSKALYRGGFVVADVVVAVVILAAVASPDSLVSRVLSVAPLRAVGLISYGLYLWHYPLFLWITQPSTGLGGVRLLVLRLAATLAVASLSYVLVETPVRQGRARGPTLALAATIGAATSLTVLVLSNSVPTPTVASGLAPVSSQRGCSVPHAGAVAVTGRFRTCHPTTVLLVGDSLAGTLGFGLEVDEASFGVEEWDKALLGCGLATHGIILFEGTWTPQNPACATELAIWDREVRTTRPQAIVVLIGFWDTFTRRWDSRTVAVGDPSFDRYVSARFGEMFTALGGGRVPIIVLGVPFTDSPAFPDGSTPPEDNPVRHAAIDTLLQSEARRTGVMYFDLDSLVSPRGRFTSTVDGQTCRDSDGIHFTVFCGELLQRQLDPLIQRLVAHDGGR